MRGYISGVINFIILNQGIFRRTYWPDLASSLLGDLHMLWWKNDGILET